MKINPVLSAYYPRFAALALLACSVVIGGCTTVRFNERETLARQDMVFDGDPLQKKIEGHVLNPRQGASGIFSTGGGGGCGCN